MNSFKIECNNKNCLYNENGGRFYNRPIIINNKGNCESADYTNLSKSVIISLLKSR